MSLWGKPVTRHYVHEVPALDGQVLKMLRTLQPGRGWQWTSRRGRRIEITRQHLAGKWPTFLVRLMNGQSQTIRLESTPAAFNGVRWWFTCPYCSRRCGRLYWTQNVTACRQCLGLHYQSQSESPRDRALRRIRTERYAIWGEDEPGINNLFCAPFTFLKPHGMHWHTFEEKCGRLVLRENRYFSALRARLDQGKL